MHKFGGDMVNSLAIDIPEADAKDVMKKMKTLLKDYKGEVKKGVSTGTIITEVSNDPIEIHFEVEEIKGGGARLISAWKLSGGFISSKTTPSQYAKARALLKEFAVKTSKEAVSEKLATAMKANDKLVKEQDKLKKEKEKLDKSIVDNKDKVVKAQNEITEAENNLKTNEANQKKKEAEIAAQKKVLDEIKKKLGSIK